MRSLGSYACALDAAIQVGREIGDIFAWFWYQNNRDLLVKHLEREKNGSLPPGIGGAGEVSLIKRYQMLNGDFILYHGITNLLRIGDVSLIDTKTLLVRSIAELKTSKLSENELRVTLIGYRPVTGKPGKPKEFPLLLADAAVPESQRLKRQMSRMEQAFSPLHSDAKISAQGMLYIDALCELTRAFKRRRLGAWVKADEGLLLFAIAPNRRRSLAARLLESRQFDPTGVEMPPPSLAREFCLEGSTENAFFFDPIETTGDAGWIPLFWLGVDQELLWLIITGKASVWSIYNPAFFLQKLRARGIEVSQSKPGRFSLRYSSQGFTMTSTDISKPLQSIRRRLMREESVVDILLGPARKVEAGEIPNFDQIEIHLLQFLGPEP